MALYFKESASALALYSHNTIESIVSIVSNNATEIPLIKVCFLTFFFASLYSLKAENQLSILITPIPPIAI
jgi:hypothetical protein